MRLEITGRQFPITPSARRLVEKRISRTITLLHESVISVHVVLARQRGMVRAEITVHVSREHFLHGEGRLYIRVFPHKSVTSIPAETRMGKGKGEPEYWVAVVKPGTVMFEITGVDEPTAKRALARVAHKMPVPCRFVERRHAVA